jgi:hypothetical protein
MATCAVLGAVHRRVGVPYELVERRAVTRIQGNPDARADDEATPPTSIAWAMSPSTAMALRSTSALLFGLTSR